MASPREVLDLVDRFHRHRDEYTRVAYKEAQVCVEFIMPIFEALGWDVYNRQGYVEAYKDVVHQHALRTASGVEAPKYCFRIGGSTGRGEGTAWDSKPGRLATGSNS